MISKEMYIILKAIPRTPKQTSFSELLSTCGVERDTLIDRLCEARYDSYEYINAGIMVENGSVSLTEKGQAAIEDYENAECNNRLVAQSAASATAANRAAKISICIAIVTMFVAIMQLILS